MTNAPTSETREAARVDPDDLLRELVADPPQSDGRCVFCWEHFGEDDPGHDDDCLITRAQTYLNSR